MKHIKRNIERHVKTDLNKKIVLISGPRQCGKTTLSKTLLPNFTYLNYDLMEHRREFIDLSWKKDVDLVILDEVHKHPNWKQHIKGIYDTQGIPPRMLVTGSAKMDTYRKMGDSLAGRFFKYRLYPFDLKELVITNKGKMKQAKKSHDELLDTLLELGGFPEPFLAGKKSYYNRWKKSHIDIILRQDLIDLEDVKHIQSIELLIELLRTRVGSPISYASLARDLQHSPITIKRWLDILEQLYIIFSVRPYHKNIARAILKAPKYYFYDNGLVAGDDGAKFENLIALSLLKNLHRKEDIKGDTTSLHYIQTKTGHEVDFCYFINEDLHLVEAKLSDPTPSKNLTYFHNQLAPASSIQVVKNLQREKNYPSGIHIKQAAKWLCRL